MKIVYRKPLIIRCLFILTLAFFLFAVMMTILNQENIDISVWIVMITIVSINTLYVTDLLFSKIEFQEDTFLYRRLFKLIIIKKNEIKFTQIFHDSKQKKGTYLVYKKMGIKYY